MDNQAVNYKLDNNVALLGCKNGPVNALGYPLRLGLKKSLNKAISDPNVDVIIIYGEGKTFPAGADISEFKTGMVNKLNLNAIFREFEHSSKPLIAACHGTCFGGGCELALCCHYRLGTEKSKYGLPEVKLGLLPGAGGTQRLPRLVGPFIALEMCTNGNAISAQKAEQIGLIDEIINVKNDSNEVQCLKKNAISFAKMIVGKPFSHLVVSKLVCETMDDFFFDQAKNMSLKKKMLAPAKIADVIRTTMKLPFEEGKKIETKAFYELATGSQARALQQTFFAQRAVSKIPGININKQALSVREIGIIGSGLMGGGIAMCFAQKGFKVILKDIKQEFLDKGMKTIIKNWKRSSMKGKWSPYQVKEMIKLIQPTLNYEDLTNADLVIEAVFENMNIKKEIFNKLSKFCKLGCIFATNTSTLNIDEIAKASNRPEKVIGLHFFSPANVMQLLETIRGSHTSKSTIATAIKIGKIIGKVPVLVGNCFGFVGNRIIFSYTAIASRLVEEGSSPYDVDKVMINFGMPMGPFQMSDLSGLDVGYKIRSGNSGKFSKKDIYYPFTVDDKMYELGSFGQKTKKGYYDYSKSRRGKPRKTTMTLIRKVRDEKHISQKTFKTQDIQQRLVFSLINEGMHCLEEKIALRPMDVDIILIFGYGFPAQLGGPMFYCDEIGLRSVYNRIKEFQRELVENPYWKESKLFQKCAEKNMGIHKHFRIMTKNNKAKL